ncbi:MAG TPA: hypothetical protein VER32_09290 [Pyrinomonadaceae bacterium]|nr:hypothetical protein [Pyrinomonadaceae bacterium]
MRKLPRPSSGPLVATALALCALALSSCATDEEADPPEPPVVVTAAQLISAYAADELSADEVYRGRLLAVSGHVVSLGRDLNEAAFVTLDPPETVSGVGVQCHFDRARAGSVARLKKGQLVTLVGRCDGKFGSVVLRGCAVPENGPPSRLDTR